MAETKSGLLGVNLEDFRSRLVYSNSDNAVSCTSRMVMISPRWSTTTGLRGRTGDADGSDS